MANLGAIGSSTKKRINSAYLPPISGLGKITGVVKQNGVDVVGTVTLMDETLDLRVDNAVGTSFAFKGLNLNRKFTIVCQNMQSTSFNALVYDRITPVPLISLPTNSSMNRFKRIFRPQMFLHISQSNPQSFNTRLAIRFPV